MFQREARVDGEQTKRDALLAVVLPGRVQPVVLVRCHAVFAGRVGGSKITGDQVPNRHGERQAQAKQADDRHAGDDGEHGEEQGDHKETGY